MMSSDDALSSLTSSMRAFINNNNNQDPNPNPNPNPTQTPNPNPNPSNKRKRNLPGNPDPDAEVIALSPKSLMATNRFICEICNKGFQRDQNLQLHRRGHNLPWKLKQRNNKEVIKKKVYICPEKSCVHHDPSRALGDLTGIKKHFSRKHGEKKWKCEKCSKKYAVQSDRKDSFITHRAFCDALAEESARFTSVPNLNFRNELLSAGNPGFGSHVFRPPQNEMVVGVDAAGNHHQLGLDGQKPRLPLWLDANNNAHHLGNANEFAGGGGGGGLAHELLQMAAAPANMLGLSSQNHWFHGSGSASSSSLPPVLKEEDEGKISSMFYNHIQEAAAAAPPAHMSATALLQKAAQMGSSRSGGNNTSSPLFGTGFGLVGSTLSSLAGSFNSRNELHHHHHQNLGKQQPQPHDQTLNGLQTSNASTLTAPANNNNNNTQPNDHHHPGLLLGDMNSSSLMGNNNLENSSSSSLMMQNTHGKHLNHTLPSGNNSEVVEGSLTRDFLGVGGNEGQGQGQGRPFFQPHELAKFASSTSSLPLNDYSRHN
ncbi:PREDICTED: protein indeterminate-domain 9-like isoform X2 [Ipomoea nil]|uniref:protein indeterminate-domain 9-like isoform X2 n=1 Tax=Ipomoea nil TaxID=35883 RepID=UPI000900F60A|nr:PREDICTED: protein indeterminate-domain 9-like isoform X2 [Ipomoea nil]